MGMDQSSHRTRKELKPDGPNPYELFTEPYIPLSERPYHQGRRPGDSPGFSTIAFLGLNGDSKPVHAGGKTYKQKAGN